MDSRLKKQVIIAAILMIAVILVIVIAANEIQRDKKASDTEQPEETSEELDPSFQAENGLNPTRDPKAFLSDDAFFDPILERVDPAVQLTLLASSVEKDLRVNVIDGYGHLVTGHIFRVHVTAQDGDVQTFQDIDEAGSLYIAPIEEEIGRAHV